MTHAVRIIFGAFFTLSLLACSSTYQAPRVFIAKGIHPLVELESIKDNRPHLKINGKFFGLPDSCVPQRRFGDAADQRKFGGDADKRKFGDAADQRKFGDEADKRKFGDAADQRKFGDDADKRKFGDAADQRKFGDEADKRKFGDAADQRKFGDEADKRNFGDAADQRKFGDDADKRKFGDATELRKFGTEANQYKCIMVVNKNATYVTGFLGSETIQAAPGLVFERATQSGSQVILYY